MRFNVNYSAIAGMIAFSFFCATGISIFWVRYYFEIDASLTVFQQQMARMSPVGIACAVLIILYCVYKLITLRKVVINEQEMQVAGKSILVEDLVGAEVKSFGFYGRKVVVSVFDRSKRGNPEGGVNTYEVALPTPLKGDPFYIAESINDFLDARDRAEADQPEADQPRGHAE